jgi:capsule polysaccharide export protein KpsE/RkpR
MVIRYSSTGYFILNNETNLELIDDPKTCDEIFEFDKMIYEQNVYNNKLFEKINEFWDDNKIMSVLSMINDYVNCNLSCIKNVIDKNINAIDDEIFDVLR